jgi:hypothetical protein
MTISLTIEVPDTLGQQLQEMQDRLPEILARGLRDVLAEQTAHDQDEEQIVAVLVSQPSPEQVLALQPSPTLQARVNELLDSNRQGTLTVEQAAELERYAVVEHLVRLSKIHAHKQLAGQSWAAM